MRNPYLLNYLYWILLHSGTQFLIHKLFRGRSKLLHSILCINKIYKYTLSSFVKFDPLRTPSSIYSQTHMLSFQIDKIQQHISWKKNAMRIMARSQADQNITTTQIKIEHRRGKHTPTVLLNINNSDYQLGLFWGK